MDTEIGGEQTQYEGSHAFVEGREKQTGQFGGSYPSLPSSLSLPFPVPSSTLSHSLSLSSPPANVHLSRRHAINPPRRQAPTPALQRAEYPGHHARRED